MPTYTAPLRDMQFVLHEMLNVESTYKAFPAYQDLDAPTINQILEEAGKFASEVIQPLNQIGDRDGCTRNPDGSVTTPAGFRAAYQSFMTPPTAARGCPCWSMPPCMKC